MYWQPHHLQPWLAALQAGQLAAAPAEGVYGYVAPVSNAEALQRILDTKQRATTKGFIVLVQSPLQLDQFCPALPHSCVDAIRTYWQLGEPATTLILPALPSLSPMLTGGLGTIAIRQPQAHYMQEYLEAAGTPLVSTSLNVTGEPPALEASAIPAGVAALTLAKALSGEPSRILNPVTNEWLR
ncbi:MAG: hypothetical protein EON60_00595 [Alphaproteobacteria bacterium]|nr:MAG: hypothetical protein EON60_00595 [Alphaproteobacteria bacterium]